MPADGLEAGIDRLRRDGAAGHVLATFAHHYERLRAGDRGMLAERDITPVDHVVALAEDDERTLPAAEPTSTLAGVAIIMLNGGLGTTMAVRGRKGLLEVKPGLTFVDLAVAQVEAERRRSSCGLPLLFLRSPLPRLAGRGASVALRGHRSQTERLAGYGMGSGRPVDVWQSLLPRLRAEDLHPVSWPAEPHLEWAPAGHGDVFSALAASGQIEELRAAGFDYARISSIDNVATLLDGRAVSIMRREQIPFLMEVADRAEADRKGGHLAYRRDGTLVLREAAQVPEDDWADFLDVTRHRFFNTNTIWVHLPTLAALLTPKVRPLDLPLIVNQKRLDPDDAHSPDVLQLETAMGSAISVFPGAAARRVQREAFDPVRSTTDLLVVRSDAYELTTASRLVLVPSRAGRKPIVDLDPRFYARQRDLDARFPHGPPSLVACDRLVVRGDITFGAGVAVRGDVTLDCRGDDPAHIPSGTVLNGS